MNAKFQYKTDDNRDNHKLAYRRVNNNTYEQLKNSTSDNVESYLNLYNKRYSKKKGLKKFDCYYEKKLYKSLNKLEKLAKKRDTSKSRIISIICRKYGLPLILLCLIPLLTLAMPKILTWRKYKKRTRVTITFSDNKTMNNQILLRGIRPNIDSSLQYCFLLISFVMVMSVIIYTYIKILKYKRVKAGMLK
ncbi:hypothetical protein PVMG_06134 [Plasmodium vivax Mauritania I]|uniref:Uncharacterized protein n=1 Tax=Plasmodium vivax Mauritania I TaxID=1035515 RepID=A0A0J9T3N9_PLAVI|nr:hypothetical protein PVMG_06134 [Plasmodium vivax Mauritania I]